MKSFFTSIGLFAFIALFGTVSGQVASGLLWDWEHLFSTVSAEENENENEDEEDEGDGLLKNQESEDKSIRTPVVTTKEVTQEVVEYQPVTKTVTVTEDGYQKDSDEDVLVDAIDPNPRIKQSEYFTDTDGDGVPNVFDRYHDEDDFAYFDDADTDDDGDGILDSYEL